jgi:hypothetical protein
MLVMAERKQVSDQPQLLAKFKKKLDVLTFEYEGDKLELEIVDGEIDLILLDSWMTQVLLKIHDKVELRKRLGGDSGLLAK